MGVLACRLQNNKFDSKGAEDLMEAALVYLSGGEYRSLKKSLDLLVTTFLAICTAVSETCGVKFVKAVLPHLNFQQMQRLP